MALPVMVNTTGSTTSPAVSAIISAANQYGVDPSIPLSIAGWETRGAYNANSYNKSDWNGYSSVGLFQLNTAPGNPGYGYTTAQLEDPATNAKIAVGLMTPAYQQGVKKGLKGTALLDYVANNTGWPDAAGVDVANKSEPSYDAGLNAFYQSANFNPGAQVVIPSQVTTDPNAPVAFAKDADAITAIDKSMRIANFDVTSPVKSLTSDAGAIALRTVLVIVGILVVAFALLAVVKQVV